ncbi:MAG TPA: hypothetical protein PKY26_05300 [Acetivibrio clariflavus]|nr:hypothetical protein [Acetivibrio clariflavus]
MKSLVTSYKKDGKVLEIYFDPYPQNPREWDNLGIMVCFHRRYSLGDSHPYKASDFNSWEEVKRAIERDNDVAVILPVYMYDHSGITLSTTPFSCPWDSGQVGWIYTTKQKLRKEYDIKYVTKKIKEKAYKTLMEEVRIYSEYVEGNVFGYILKDESGRELDSCWGFYGTDFNTNGIAEYVGFELVS